MKISITTAMLALATLSVGFVVPVPPEASRASRTRGANSAFRREAEPRYIPTAAECECPDDKMMESFKNALKKGCEGFRGEPNDPATRSRSDLCAEFQVEYGLELTLDLGKDIIKGVKAALGADAAMEIAVEEGLERALRKTILKQLKKPIKDALKEKLKKELKELNEKLKEDKEGEDKCPPAIYASGKRRVAGKEIVFRPYVVVIELLPGEQCCYRATMYQTYRENPGLTPAKYNSAVYTFDWCCPCVPQIKLPPAGEWKPVITR